MTTFGQKLRMYRAEKNLQATELANILGVPKQTVSTWEKTISKPYAKRRREIEKILNFEPFYLDDDFVELPNNTLQIIGYATAGLLEEQYQQDLGYVEVPQKFANNEKYIAVKVSGDSMNRIFEDETITVFDRNTQTFQNKIVLAEVNNQTTIKRFYDYGNVIVLKPDSYNPNHQDIIIKKEEIETLKIYGRLVYYCKEVL